MSLFPTRFIIPLKSLKFSWFYAAMRSLAELILHNIARVSATKTKKLIHEFSHLLKGQQNRISLMDPTFDCHVVVPNKMFFWRTTHDQWTNPLARTLMIAFQVVKTSSGFHYEIIWGVAIFTDKYNVREFYQFNYILSFSGV